MDAFNWKKDLQRDGPRVVFSGQPFAMHCHHYNINLQRTLEDTLGEEGVALLFRSAEEANFANFQYLLGQYGRLRTEKSKFEMASILFQNCGMGIIYFQQVDENGGVLVSPASHHVTGWLAKHGRRETPGCHFTRGWIAGALEAIYGKSPGYYTVRETACKMARDPDCVFEVRPAG